MMSHLQIVHKFLPQLYQICLKECKGNFIGDGADELFGVTIDM